MWRKNRGANPNSDCVGTDLNRNWSFHWGGLSTTFCHSFSIFLIEKISIYQHPCFYFLFFSLISLASLRFENLFKFVSQRLQVDDLNLMNSLVKRTFLN